MRERIPIRPGDLFRSPDRPTARWHRVIRVGRRKDGSRYITIRRGRLGRLLGLGPLQRLEWASVKALGYGIKRGRSPVLEVAGASQADAFSGSGAQGEAKGRPTGD